jgi:hypothetical protein
MTKRKSKSTKSTVKAVAAKASVTKSSNARPATTPPLIVLGFDDQQKPRGARFVDAKPDLVTKAADLMGFKVYETSPPDVAEYAKKLPVGRLYANGRGFVPNIRQSLYSDLVVVLGQEPQAALSRNGNGLPVALGLPRSWPKARSIIRLCTRVRFYDEPSNCKPPAASSCTTIRPATPPRPGPTST